MKKNYLLDYLNSLGDTNMGIAMRDVFDSKNCIFSNNSNSHPTAFQTYLYEDETPFCLFGSNGQSSSTMVHEIGHYYASYTNHDLNNYDLCETHSQGNEFLFLQFCKDELPTKVYEPVRYYNLFNAYYVIVMATVIDDFEQRVYSLDNKTINKMTSEDFDALMDEVLLDYGKDAEWFADNLADVHEYWRKVAIDNPVYYISYAVSAVASVEIFAIAEDDYEAAQQAYITLVEGVDEEDGFLEALKKAGLTTPFEEETFKKVSATMSK
jgi:oligoendopeptidase F